MTSRPILLNSEMVRAILNGRKTQTRRVILPQIDLLNCPAGNDEGWDVGTFDGEPVQEQCEFCYCHPKSVFKAIQNCPYGQKGDQLWVRTLTTDNRADHEIFLYKALEITGVRVERVNKISDDDAKAEGVTPMTVAMTSDPDSIEDRYDAAFLDLWDRMSKPEYKWKNRPWVWVLEFKKI